MPSKHKYELNNILAQPLNKLEKNRFKIQYIESLNLLTPMSASIKKNMAMK